eukprot:12916638-Prorocentrum_lima.AAC.1
MQTVFFQVREGLPSPYMLRSRASSLSAAFCLSFSVLGVAIDDEAISDDEEAAGAEACCGVG